MKHGRPAVTVHALAREGEEIRLADLLLDLTGSLGVRYAQLDRRILTRRFEKVEIEGVEVAVKVSVRSDGSVAAVGPEFRDVQALARQLGVTEREALRRAREAIDS